MRWIQKYIKLPEAGEPEASAIAVLLTRDAENFLRAGGVLSAIDWMEMDEKERAAFITAGDRLRAERIYLEAFAARGPVQAAMIAKAFDGGDSLKELVLNSIADQVQAELSKGEN